ncbi:hypothetical protein [Chryseobacterium sp.]|uniref:hypothetical protein n=1 Tax=Chryseobacterium sp. TaxID=1871047 RepID=UPI00289D14B1|nr:hypothetical protein [Chryseobacterium sp.]
MLDVNLKKLDKAFGRYYLTRYESARNSDYQKTAKNSEITSTAALSPYPKSNIFENDFKSDDEKEFKTKGYLIFNLERKSVETFLTDVSEIPLSSQIKLKEIFNTSYGKWNFSKLEDIRYIKVPFVAICYKIKIFDNTLSNISVGYNITHYNQITIPLDTQKIIDAEKYNTIAIKCFESKNYSCAAENFKRSFLQNKYNLDAHYNYAFISNALGKKEVACEKWRELIVYGQKEALSLFKENQCDK